MIPRFVQIPAVRRFVETTLTAFHPTRPDLPWGSVSERTKIEVTTLCDRERRIDPRWLGQVAFFGLVKDCGRRIAGAEVSEPLPIGDLPAPAVDGTVWNACYANAPEQAERLDRALMTLPRPIRAIGATAIHITCSLGALRAVDPHGQIAFNLQIFGECIFRGGHLPTALARGVFFHVDGDRCTITIPAPVFCEAAYASNPDLHPRNVAYVPGKIPFGDIFHLLVYQYRHVGLMSDYWTIHRNESEHPLFLALHDLMYHMAHLVQVPQEDIERVADFISDCIAVCPALAYEMPLWPKLESPADAYAGWIAPERSPLYQLHFVVRPFITAALPYLQKWGAQPHELARLGTHLLLLERGLSETAKTWRPPADWLG